jgi:hypothetical protein
VVRPRRNPTPDGRANNGGVRQGTPGVSYPNRSDMRGQPIATAKGQTYGQAGAQAAAQRAVPLAAAPPPPAPAAPVAAAPGAGGPPPEQPDLYRPTERPHEPVTHGLPMGPGAGPDALPIQQTGANDPVAIQIRAMFRANPTNQELADLVAELNRPR